MSRKKNRDSARASSRGQNRDESLAKVARRSQRTKSARIQYGHHLAGNASTRGIKDQQDQLTNVPNVDGQTNRNISSRPVVEQRSEVNAPLRTSGSATHRLRERPGMIWKRSGSDRSTKFGWRTAGTRGRDRGGERGRRRGRRRAIDGDLPVGSPLANIEPDVQ